MSVRLKHQKVFPGQEIKLFDEVEAGSFEFGGHLLFRQTILCGGPGDRSPSRYPESPVCLYP